MSFDNIKTGCVIEYPYLCAREDAEQKTEGFKPRPVAVGVRMPAKVEGGNDAALLFAITSKEPVAGVEAIETPEIEKRRSGLDQDKRLWIILDEYNFDLVVVSYYLDCRFRRKPASDSDLMSASVPI